MILSKLFSRKVQAESAVAGGDCEPCLLTSLPVGQPACLVCVHTSKRLRRRLAELGLTPGVEMRVLRNSGGPLLVSVRDSRLALGRGMADKLDVSPLRGEALR